MALKLGMAIVALTMMALLPSVLYAGLPQFPITPYSNASQFGYHVINISTYGYFTATIGSHVFNTTQNYISPNEAGVTINNVSYNLYPGKPVPIVNENGSYVMLVKVNYIPRLHNVNLNIYSLQPTTTTTISTTSVSTTSTTTAPPTTTLYTAPSTSTVSTTAMQQGATTTGSIISQLIAAIKGFLSRL